MYSIEMTKNYGFSYKRTLLYSKFLDLNNSKLKCLHIKTLTYLNVEFFHMFCKVWVAIHIWNSGAKVANFIVYWKINWNLINNNHLFQRNNLKMCNPYKKISNESNYLKMKLIDIDFKNTCKIYSDY